jgi:FAD synthase
LGLAFVARLRPERKFADATELRTQIEVDVTTARRLLGLAAPSPEASA